MTEPPSLDPAVAASPIGRPPVWPAVIGILAIVLAASSLLGNWFGLASMTRAVSGRGGPLALTTLVADQALLLVTVALAVTGGALLLTRRPAGATLLKISAVVRIVQMLAAPAAQWVTWGLFLGAPMRWWPLWQGVSRMLLGLPWPIFLLIWLRRRESRRLLEQFRDPARRGGLRPVTGSVWPTAIGLIVLLLSGTSILGTAYLLLGLPLTFLLSQASLSMLAHDWEVLLWHVWQSAGPQAIGVLGGILLWRRRRSATTALLVYAVLRALTVIATPVVMGLLYPRQLMDIRFLSTQMLTGLPHLVLPVFVMIWILLPKVRRQMRSWRRNGEN
jgi:hypothetical protein